MKQTDDRPDWRLRFKAFLLWCLARAWLATLRVEVRGREKVEKLRQSGPLVYVFWHGSQFALFRANPEKKLAALTSLSRDGRMQALILQRFGVRPVFGSSSRGGLRGLLALGRALNQGWSVAMAADGPRGPAREAKAGAVALASAAGRPLVPVGVWGRRKLVFRRAWDRFMLPCPFSRVTVCFGEPLQMERVHNRTQLQACCDSLTRAINGLEDRLMDESQSAQSGNHKLGLFLYRFVWILFLPLVLLYFLARPKLRHGLTERLGGRAGGMLRQPTGVVWFHAASAGDVLALEPVARALKERRPELFFLLTAVTDSGWRMAGRLKAFDLVRYAPFDIASAPRRLIRAYRPQVLVLQQAELWPEMLNSARSSGVKVVLINGRLHPRRLAAYRVLFRLVGNLLRQMDVLCLSAADDLERARALGAEEAKLKLVGNSKFDALPQPPAPADLAGLKAALAPRDEPLWLAGSTHRGEERIVLQAFLRLRQRHPLLRLVIAPRYPERSSEVTRMARSMGLSVGRRSRGEVGEVIVLDTMGELRAACYLARMVFVGGSLVPRGGHNLLEPALAARPVLFGPHQDNFPQAAEVLRGQGGFEVSGPEQLAQVVDYLLTDPLAAERLGREAREAVMSRRQAAQACAGEILRLLEH